MSTGAVGNEIELTRARRIGRSVKRGAAGVGNGSGRQSLDLICIVWSGLFDLTLHDRPAQRALSADQSINDCRVGLQLHSQLQPIEEYCSDTRSLVRFAGLL